MSTDEIDAGAAPPGDDNVTRHRQADALRDLARRLEAGDRPIPTDVFAAVEGELELRLDDDAIDAAYAEQGQREEEPWVYCRGRVQG